MKYLMLSALLTVLTTLSTALPASNGRHGSVAAPHLVPAKHVAQLDAIFDRGIVKHQEDVVTATVTTTNTPTPSIHLKPRSTDDSQTDDGGWSDEKKALVGASLALFLGVPMQGLGTWSTMVIEKYGWPFETIPNVLKIKPWSHPEGQAPPRLMQQFETVYDTLLKVRYGLRDAHPSVWTFAHRLGPKTMTKLLDLVNDHLAEGSEATIDSSEASGIDTIDDGSTSGGSESGSPSSEGGSSGGSEGTVADSPASDGASSGGSEGTGSGSLPSGGSPGTGTESTLGQDTPPSKSPSYPNPPPPTGDNPWTSSNPNRIPHMKLPEPAKPLEPITPNGDASPEPNPTRPDAQSSNGSDRGDSSGSEQNAPASPESQSDFNTVEPAPRPTVTYIRHIKADGSSYLTPAEHEDRPAPHRTMTIRVTATPTAAPQMNAPSNDHSPSMNAPRPALPPDQPDPQMVQPTTDWRQELYRKYNECRARYPSHALGRAADGIKCRKYQPSNRDKLRYLVKHGKIGK